MDDMEISTSLTIPSVSCVVSATITLAFPVTLASQDQLECNYNVNVANISSAQITSMSIDSLDISGAIGSILSIVSDFTDTLTTAIENELVSVAQGINLLPILKPMFASSKPVPVSIQLPGSTAVIIAQ